jgi:hypothetical protein
MTIRDIIIASLRASRMTNVPAQHYPPTSDVGVLLERMSAHSARTHLVTMLRTVEAVISEENELATMEPSEQTEGSTGT